ncbi:MAG: hypothetical protein LBB90_03070 [Tannerella sp.]|jgi:hypothetical protein|nr:hypothetical protein [Tannerella sp.]
MKIRQLLKKFYEGRSTPEEERALRDYFLSALETDASLQTDKEIFRALAGAEVRMPEGLSLRLENTLEQLAAATPARKSARRTWLHAAASVAAVALLCIGLFFATREPSGRQRADTFDDPQEAAMVAGKALAFMSGELNRGLNRVAEADTEIEKINQIVSKYFNE